MPTDLFQGVDLDLYYPPFLERLLAYRADLRARDLVYVTRSGFISPAKAREMNAAGGLAEPPFSSPHNYGLADLSVRILAPPPGPALHGIVEALAGNYGLQAELFSEPGSLRVTWPGAWEWLQSLRMRWISTDTACRPERERYRRKLAACWELIDAASAAASPSTSSAG